MSTNTEREALDYIARRLQADIDDGSRPDQWSMEDMVRKCRAALEAAPVAPAEPPKFDRTTALVLLSAASKSGDPGAISLAAQLAGAAPCDACGFVNFRCRCAPQPAATAAAEPPDWRLAAATFLRMEAEQQDANNKQWPDHAKHYPSWTQRVDFTLRLAEKLEMLHSAMPYGLDAAAAPAAPQAAETTAQQLLAELSAFGIKRRQLPQGATWTWPGITPGAAAPAAPQARPGLTDEQIVACLTEAGCHGGAMRMSYGSGPYEITRPTINAVALVRAIEAAHGIGTPPAAREGA